MYQSRSLDFSEEVNAHFVKTFLKLNDPVGAAQVIAKREHRLGAWTARNANKTLMESLAANGEVQHMINVTESLRKKGVLFEPAVSADILMKGASVKGDPALYEAASEICAKIVSETDFIALRHSHPGPALSTPENEASTSIEPPSAV